MNADQQQADQSPRDAELPPSGKKAMSRREALAIVGKHAVYTAPAVLAILAATKSNSAHAAGGGGGGGGETSF